MAAGLCYLQSVPRFLALLCLACACQAQNPAAYRPVIESLESWIPEQMADKQIAGLSIALVDSNRVVWTRGFGTANAETVHRVGSVSKLFTDLAIMQLVERGTLSLDIPVGRYLNDFRPVSHFAKPITLRELMAHRAGLVREPPAGHYFDSTNPTLEQTVKSLNDTELVLEPGSKTKYSNAGVAVAGCVLERTQRQPFARLMRERLLDPLLMKGSAFEPAGYVTSNLAKAFMWSYTGRQFEAPNFQLGMAPAGSLYTSVADLASFLKMLAAGGEGPNGAIVRRETLEQMWTPQFAAQGARTGYGLGFNVSQFEGRRMVSHGGAIYGFATELALLPEDKLGVAVVATRDAVNAVTSRVAQVALRAMLAARYDKFPPAIERFDEVSEELGRKLEGRYGQYDMAWRNGRLYGTPLGAGTRVEWKRAGGELIADGPLSFGARLRIDPSLRMDAPKPAPAPPRWNGLIGEYGWDYDKLWVLERDGKLSLLIEWFFYDPLEERGQNLFHLSTGLYHDEDVEFTRAPNGRAASVRIGGVTFPRRPDPAAPGSTYRITPLRPVEQLRREALELRPPANTGTKRESDLVELTTLDPTIKLDIRYATADNFMGAAFYSDARAFLQRPAAQALVRANRQLAGQGYGLVIHDAYRPWYVTWMFWQATPPDQRMFVANPAEGSRHNRGCAVDLSLYDLKTGRAVRMTSGYDEMSERAYPDYPGGTELERWQRDLLRRTMEAGDFAVQEVEWWHFDYKDWADYPVLNEKR